MVEPYEGAKLERLSADAATVMARYPSPRSALLPLLHLVQSEDGWVSPDGIVFCAHTLGLTTTEVSAVATFYTQFKRRPNGEYTVGVCTNTLCAVLGGDAVFEKLSDHLGVGQDETTPDGAITLERIECNSACDHAPVMMVNWEFFDNQTPGSATGVVDRLRAGEPVAPTRGASSVCSFRAMSRVLAGFEDGRADEGVGAGEPTLAGVRLAGEKGWTAPGSPSVGAVEAPAAPKVTGTTEAALKAAAPKRPATKRAAPKATGTTEAAPKRPATKGSAQKPEATKRVVAKRAAPEETAPKVTARKRTAPKRTASGSSSSGEEA
jgi:NADH-quinone oxidoreductase subunit E